MAILAGAPEKVLLDIVGGINGNRLIAVIPWLFDNIELPKDITVLGMVREVNPSHSQKARSPIEVNP